MKEQVLFVEMFLRASFGVVCGVCGTLTGRWTDSTHMGFRKK